MKNLITLLFALTLLTSAAFSQVAINTNGNTANTSAMLDISSTSKGLLIPSMSSSQRGNIDSPANGLLVYDTDTKSFWYYNSTATEWQKVGNSTGGVTDIDGLSDGKSDDESVFLGAGSGQNDDGGNQNTAIGKNSLQANTSGSQNTALGHKVLTSNQTGSENTGTGMFSLYTNTTGKKNVAAGSNSLAYNTVGDNNTATGSYSSARNTTGNYNVGIGAYANEHNQEGSSNTIIGYKAGGTLTNHNKSGNIFLGYQAGYSETGDNKLYIENSSSSTPLIGGDFSANEVYINGTMKITGGTPGTDKILTSDASGNATWEVNPGATDLDELSDAKTGGYSVFVGNDAGSNDDGTNNYNTAQGYTALSQNVSGDNNTAIGYGALTKNNNNDNTALGSSSLYYNNSGNNNTALGRESLYENTSGNYNVGIGSLAGFSNKTGSNNTLLGHGAGYGSTGQNPSGSVFIGYRAGYLETNDNKLYIENSASPIPLIGGDFSTNEVQINGSIKITGGSPGNGKILTSDASGIASWETNQGASSIDGLSDAKYDGSSVFLGNESGNSDDGSNSNAAVGRSSLKNNIGGQNNCAFGLSSLYMNTSGSNNVALGFVSMYSNTTGHGNTAIGGLSLNSNTTGHSNIAVGYGSLKRNTTKHNLVAIGDSSLFNNGIGATLIAHSSQNTAVGSKSLYSNTIGTENTGLGFESLKANTTGNTNVAFGSKSLFQSVDGSSNTAIGCNSLSNLTSGTANTAIGQNAGLYATGSYNIFLGNSAGLNEAGSHKLYIDISNTSAPLIWGDFNTNIAAINGKLGIGTQTPTEELEVVGSAKISNNLEVDNDITVVGDFNYSASKTYVLQIPAAGFEDVNADYSAFSFVNADHWLANEGDHGHLFAVLSLPQAAVVTGLSTYIQGYGEGEIEVTLRRRPLFSDWRDDMCEIVVTDASIYSDISELTTNTISYNTIDNTQYHYVIQITMDTEVGEGVRFYGTKITYTIDKVP